jgi:hypothetical protein
MHRLFRSKGSSEEFAALIIGYVDDMRAAARSEEEFWQTINRVASFLNYLGIRIASQKTCSPAKHLGHWAGSMVVSDIKGVGVKEMQEKW